MKKSEKIFATDNLTEKLKDAKSVVLADYRGLTVGQIELLRRAIKKAGGQMMVIKNTLIERAIEDAKAASQKLDIQGPSAIILSYEDEIAPIKAIADFAKINGLPEFKFGLLDGQVLSKEQVEALSKLPTRNQLLANLVSQLASPTQRLVYTLANNPHKLILILKSLSNPEKQNKGGEN